MATYRNLDGRLMFVSGGIGNRSWSTYWKRQATDTAIHRLRTMPIRDSAVEAQADLDELAARKRWPAESAKEDYVEAITTSPAALAVLDDTRGDATATAPPAPDDTPLTSAGDSARNRPAWPSVPLVPMTVAAIADSARNQLLWLEPGAITPNPRNPRRRFEEDALEELADSIRRHGLLEPLVVRPLGDGYELIAGERRLRAAKSAGLSAVPVIVRDASDEESLELAIVENLARRDLNPMEEARGYRELMALGRTQGEIGQVVRRSQEAISNTVRLLDLPDEIQERISAGELTASHGRALLRWRQVAPQVLCLIAQAVAELHVPARELEAGVPYSVRDRLQIAGMTRWTYQLAHEYKEKCNSCASNLTGYCIQPECWDRIMSEEQEATRQRQAAKEGTVQSAKDVRAAGMIALGWPTPPTACALEACDQSVWAEGRGGKAELFCGDRACYTRLKCQDDERREHAVNAYIEQRVDAVREKLDSGTLPLWQAFAVVVRAALVGVYDKKHVTEAMQDAGLQFDVGALFEDTAQSAVAARHALEELQKQEGPDLMRWLIFLRIRRELRDIYGGDVSNLERAPQSATRFLLGEPPIDPSNGASASDASPDDQLLDELWRQRGDDAEADTGEEGLAELADTDPA